MTDHFNAFSFVDRITSIDPGVRITGTYNIPADVVFPPMLVPEAIGQLAAWVAMSAVDFKFRPVAGLIGKYEQFSEARPGQILELTAELDEVTSEALAYSGTARVNGVPVARIERCVGPMMPMEDFDDPSAGRERFELIRANGASGGGFRGLPIMPIDAIGGQEGKLKRGIFRVPGSAPFFADHFPRRPVFPGTMLIGKNFELVFPLVSEIPAAESGGAWKLTAVKSTKFRAFTPPSSTLDCEARLDSVSGSDALILIECREATKMVASAKAFFSAAKSS